MCEIDNLSVLGRYCVNFVCLQHVDGFLMMDTEKPGS